MSDDPKVTDPPTPAPAPQPTFMTKEQVEQMLAAQTQQFAAMIQRTVETLSPPRPADAPAPKPALSFYDNPEQAAAALVDAKLKPVKDAYVANELTRGLAEVATLPFADKLMDEIKAVLAKTPAEVAVQPGALREVYHMALGRHAAELPKWQEEADKVRKERTPEFTETTTSAAPAARKSGALTAEEAKVAEATGMAPEEYRKWRDNRAEMAEAALAGKRS